MEGEKAPGRLDTLWKQIVIPGMFSLGKHTRVNLRAVGFITIFYEVQCIWVEWCVQRREEEIKEEERETLHELTSSRVQEKSVW